jgi:DNA-binding beta-propeller fold protein YncE
VDAFREGLTLYLDRDGAWGDFATFGLDRGDDGTLRLASLPRLATPPAGLATLPAPSGPGGLAIAPNGDVVFTIPEQHRIAWIDGCTPGASPVAWLSGDDDPPARIREPRGLLYHPQRRALLVADSGHGRVLVFDLATRQFLGFWDAPGVLQSPVALAADADGTVCVADAAARRVVKIDARGQEVAGFWERTRPGIPHADEFQPVALAIAPAGGPALVILDGSGRVVVCDLDGSVRAWFPTLPATRPLGMAVHADSVYLGDNQTRRVLRFRLTG